MKKKYESPSIRFSEIQVKDVITTSGFDGPGQEFSYDEGSSASLPDSRLP